MSVIASIGKDLDRAIAELFPEADTHTGSPGTRLNADDLFAAGYRRVAARRSGYVNGVDYDGLVRIAAGARLRIRVPHHPGQFVARGAALAEIVSDDGNLPSNGSPAESIVEAFEIGDDRAAGQDVEYHIDQLVEIAVRSLSPAINDPFTAIACIDRLGASLRLLARRRLPSPHYFDRAGVLRVVTKTQTFEGALDAAFNLIRQYGHTSPAVAMRLIETIAVIAEHTADPAETRALLGHATMVEHAARVAMSEAADIAALEERFDVALRALRSTEDDDAL
jgi:uncharacterized membrane protein